VKEKYEKIEKWISKIDSLKIESEYENV